MSQFKFLLLVFLQVSQYTFLNAKDDCKNSCEVCKSVIGRLKERVGDKDKDEEYIKNELKEMCKGFMDKDERFCYYVGALETSATGNLKEISSRLSYLDPEMICEKLKKFDSQIGELNYPKPIDWKNVVLKKLKVKELKKILSTWNEKCEECLEKGDFIRRIEELKPKYVKEEL